MLNKSKLLKINRNTRMLEELFYIENINTNFLTDINLEIIEKSGKTVLKSLEIIFDKEQIFIEQDNDFVTKFKINNNEIELRDKDFIQIQKKDLFLV